MKREEAVQTNLQIKQYMEKNKLRPMFAELTKQLLLKKPDDPISFLIEYLNKRSRKQIVCLKGYDNDQRTRIANIACNKFNFKLIDVSSLFTEPDYHFLNDKNINDKVLNELKNCDSVYKGIVISGYPNNFVQLDFIQKSGYLPDRYFYLPYDEVKIREKYAKEYNAQQTDNLIKRNQMEDQEMKENLGDMLDCLPLDFDTASNILNSTLSIKAKKNIPYDSPRAIFIHPPYLCPPNMESIINKFSLYHITLQKSMNLMCAKQSFKDYVEQYIRKAGRLSKQIQLALIETQSRCPSARNKGFVISGWPCRKQSVKFFKQKFLNPHIIFIFDCDVEKCVEQFGKLNEGDPNIFSINKKPSTQQYRQQLKEYQQVVETLRDHQKLQILPWDQSQKQLTKTFESLVENIKIYC